MERKLLNAIVDFYLTSQDFNGIPVYKLFEEVTEEDIKKIRTLVQKGFIIINWGYPHENIHIQAYAPLDIQNQLKWLDDLRIDQLKSKKPPIFKHENFVIESPSEKSFCMYPSAKILKRRVKRNKYPNKPFLRKLALGEPQLKPYFFDLSVLDDYMNDPRFSFKSDGVSGSIFIKKGNVPKKDAMFVEHFGYGIKLEKGQYERCLAVFLTDLTHLSANQQQRWLTKIIGSKKFFIHPEYDRISRGNWALKISIFQAFREELPIINTMFRFAFGKRLFKRDNFTDEELSQFHFIIRPTKELYYSFVHLLDKLISENIDKSFFEDSLIEKVKKEINNDPGTLILLRRWLDEKVKLPDPEPKDEMIDIFRKIRSERQRPGHLIDTNEWNKKYWNMQRILISDAYNAIRALRLIISSHPHAKAVEVPEWLYKGEICDY